MRSLVKVAGAGRSLKRPSSRGMSSMMAKSYGVLVELQQWRQGLDATPRTRMSAGFPP
jgi:hypothetical protein